MNFKFDNKINNYVYINIKLVTKIFIHLMQIKLINYIIKINNNFVI